MGDKLQGIGGAGGNSVIAKEHPEGGWWVTTCKMLPS
jgi:hypothetical protein